MKNKIIIAIAIIAVMLAAGCTTKDDSSTSKTTPFIGGTTGLLIDYGSGNPPAEVYDGGDYPFEITVKLENKGEYKILKNDVQVKITGIRAEEFGLSEASLTKSPDEDVEATEKDSEGNIRQSTPVYVEFSGLNRKAELTGNTEYKIRAEVCYMYETAASSKICIKEDNLDIADSVCIVNEAKKVFSSAAPVQVQEFTEVPRAKNKVQFSFNVQKSANGGVYQKDSRCEDERAIEDKVWVEIDTGMSGLNCNGLNGGTVTSGYVTLYGGVRTVTCTQEVTTSSDYEVPVDITLKYKWMDLKETTILVKHSPND